MSLGSILSDVADPPLSAPTRATSSEYSHIYDLFDDGGDGRYRGVWTYDPSLVDRAFAAVE